MASNSTKKYDAILTCKVCHMYYTNPVLLPCGKSICRHHINDEIGNDLNKKEYKCELCRMRHDIPENGFLINGEMIDLLNLNDHSDEKTKDAFILIDELDHVRKQLELVNDPDNFVHDYVSDIRNKLDLRREIFKLNIDDIHDDMITKVNDFEKECKANLKTYNFTINSAVLEKKMNEWKRELRNPRIKETSIDNIMKQTNLQMKQEENNLFECSNKILNGKGCVFDSGYFKIEQDNFGKLIFDDLKKTNELNKTIQMKLDDNHILTPNLLKELIELCDFDEDTRFDLLYKASRDGFSAKNFHSKCDHLNDTLTIIKVKDKPHIFGGYTKQTWDDRRNVVLGYKNFKKDRNAFIFSLVNDDNYPIKIDVTQHIKQAIYCDHSSGPSFGGGHDFYISSNSNKNKDSYSNLGLSYIHPYYTYESTEAENFLAGSNEFSTSEIEVYQVKDEDLD